MRRLELGPDRRRGDGSCVIPDERQRSDQEYGRCEETGDIGPGVRRGDGSCVIPAKAGIEV
jgi:hypothetical protein